MTDDEMRRMFDAIRQDRVDAHAETRRHFEAVAERVEKKIDALSEAVAAVDEKLDRDTDEIREDMRRGFS